MLKIKNINFKEKFAEAHLRQRIYEGTSYITLMATIEFYPKFVNDSILSGALDIKVDMKDIHSLKDLEEKELKGEIGNVTISVNNDDIWEHNKSGNFSIKLGKINGRELEFMLKTEECELDTTLELISLYTTSSKEEELKKVFSLDDFYSKTLEKKVGTSQIIKYFVKE